MEKAELPALKVDRTKLHTPANYAKKIGKSERTVRRMLADGFLKTETISGILFIYE